jgi:Hemerythrin HHE cation binding domain
MTAAGLAVAALVLFGLVAAGANPMAQPPATMQLADRADWALMIAIHDALRRDLDQLLHATAGHASGRPRWGAFRSQLRFHLAAEHAAMWPRVRPKLASDPHGQALLDAMDDERQLLGPLQAMIDDAFTIDADPGGSASCWPGCGPGWPALAERTGRTRPAPARSLRRLLSCPLRPPPPEDGSRLAPAQS